VPLSLQTAPVLSHSVASVGLPRTLLRLPAYSQNRADSVGSTAKSSASLFSLILASVSLPRRGSLCRRKNEARTRSQRVLDVAHGDWHNH